MCRNYSKPCPEAGCTGAITCQDNWACPEHQPELVFEDDGPDAPVEPHAPTSGPDSTPRGSQDADAADGHTEALTVRLADHAARFIGCIRHVKFVGECNADAEECTADHDAPTCLTDDEPWPCRGADLADALRSLVVAYGDERAAEALREAADAHELAVPPELGDWWAGFRQAAHQARDMLRARADELGPRP